MRPKNQGVSKPEAAGYLIADILYLITLGLIICYHAWLILIPWLPFSWGLLWWVLRNMSEEQKWWRR